MVKRLGCLAVALFSLFAAQPSYAETCYALSSGNRLVRFDSTAPAMGVDVGAITGLGGAFSVVGIDIRTTTQTVGAANPGVGSLWGIAYNGTEFLLCVINPATAVATPIGGLLAMDDSGGADGFGFGFDPSRDRFQFISVQFNYEIDPNTATFTQQTSFPGFPAHSGAAFTTASFGGASTFYNISRQSSPRTLQSSADISAGVVTPVNPGGLGSDVNAPLGIDIAGNLFLLANSDDVALYSINRATGTKSLIGPIGGGAPGFRGLAIMPTSFPPTLPVSVKIKGKKKVTTSKAKYTVKGTASSGAGITRVEYKLGNGGFKNAKGTTRWTIKARLKAGVNKLQVRAIGGNDITSSPAKIKIVRK